MSFNKEDFIKATNVSRETLEKLCIYENTLRKWQSKINLISSKTLNDIWFRHFYDSAQIFSYLPKDTKNLIDMGSGAGFPALVLAIMGVKDVHLFESDSRKCAFLRQTAIACDIKVTIYNKRIELIEPFFVDVITARALSSLSQLLEYAKPFVNDKTLCIFQKGKLYKEELTKANYVWHINSEEIISLTDNDGRLILIKEYSYVSNNSRKINKIK